MWREPAPFHDSGASPHHCPRDAADAASGIVLVMRVHLDLKQRYRRPHRQRRATGFKAQRVSTRAGQSA
ncbi:hypothetical protein, partial [Dokdonella sp.]|uniref:hypothetical protein n=1 Tax=Dokdonella sp. TaxID=2291710 RepID=UPI003C73BB66